MHVCLLLGGGIGDSMGEGKWQWLLLLCCGWSLWRLPPATESLAWPTSVHGWLAATRSESNARGENRRKLWNFVGKISPHVVFELRPDERLRCCHVIAIGGYSLLWHMTVIYVCACGESSTHCACATMIVTITCHWAEISFYGNKITPLYASYFDHYHFSCCSFTLCFKTQLTGNWVN